LLKMVAESFKFRKKNLLHKTKNNNCKLVFLIIDHG
jgi:hypothetical protein